MSNGERSAATPEGQRVWNEINYKIESFVASAQRHRRLAIFLEWGTPVAAFLGTISAIFGDQTKVVTTVVGGLVTFMGAVNVKVSPRTEAVRATERFNAWKEFEIPFKTEMRRIYNETNGRDTKYREQAEGVFLREQNKALTELRAKDPNP